MTRTRFLADEMNGDLARWLRMLGYDCAYSSLGEAEEDEQVVERAVREDRTLLTSDSELFKRALRSRVPVVLTSGSTREERLAQLVRKTDVDLELDRCPSRCTSCNGVLREADRDDLEEGEVEIAPPDMDRFWVCSRCGKAYWVGSHWSAIRRTIERVKHLVSD